MNVFCLGPTARFKLCYILRREMFISYSFSQVIFAIFSISIVHNGYSGTFLKQGNPKAKNLLFTTLPPGLPGSRRTLVMGIILAD